jgi:lia operon protein LiaG
MLVSAKRIRALLPPAATGAMLAALTVTPALAQGVERFQIAGDKVAIYNLAGVAILEPGTGSAVVIELKRGGRDAGRLEVEQGPIGGASTLRVVYPDDQIVYDPPNGTWHGSSNTSVREDGTFGEGRGGRDVRIHSSGSGMEAWGDLRIAVPRGQQFSLHLVAGEMTVTNVNGTLFLDGGSTNTTSSGTTGSLSIDVGSGDVRVRTATGDVKVDTGSGDVWIDGSGDGDVWVDTGSGDVSLGRLRARSVRIDTGSGTVDGTQVVADDLAVDTGSGDVRLAFDGSPKNTTVDTGSGTVMLTFPTGYSAAVDLETSSGSFTVDFPLRVTRRERDHVRGVIGSGVGQLKVDTGSGDIQIKQR